MKKTSKIIIVIMSAITALLAISLISNAQLSEQTIGVTNAVYDTEIDETDISASYSSWENSDCDELNFENLDYDKVHFLAHLRRITASGVGVDNEPPTNQKTEYSFKEETTDYFDRPFLGITGISINEHIVETYNLSSIGVLVESVMEDSAAKNADIKPLDIIVGFNDIKITTMEQLWDAIGRCNIGDKITIDLYRNELSMQFEVVLGSVPEMP